MNVQRKVRLNFEISILFRWWPNLLSIFIFITSRIKDGSRGIFIQSSRIPRNFPNSPRRVGLTNSKREIYVKKYRRLRKSSHNFNSNRYLCHWNTNLGAPKLCMCCTCVVTRFRHTKIEEFQIYVPLSSTNRPKQWIIIDTTLFSNTIKLIYQKRTFMERSNT